MHIWHSFAEARTGLNGQATGVTVGTFDGLHLGHQAVIAELNRQADQRSLVSLAVTFDQHPASVVGHEAPPLLITVESRLECLAALGVDVTLLIAFDAGFAAMDPASFITERVVVDLGARLAVVGHDFRFGARGAGDASLLATVGGGCGLEVIQIPPTIIEGAIVSSTAIRWALAAGDIITANRLLGRPYTVRGRVVLGERRGRKIGFPTANLTLAPGALWPRYGVYLVEITAEDAARYVGVANVGVKPTFGGRNKPGSRSIFLDTMATCIRG